VSPKEVTEKWIEEATEGQLQNMLYHLIDHSMEASVLAYQFASADA
jgi:hypothetical protein